MLPCDGPFRPDCIALSMSAQGSGKHPTMPADRLDPAEKHNSRKGDADGRQQSG